MRRHGLTLIEVVAGLAGLILLLGIALPLLAQVRCDGDRDVSAENLRRLGVAHAMYAEDWNDRQFTLVRDDLGVFGGNCEAYNQGAGCHPGLVLGDDCKGDTVGFFWGCDENGGNCLSFDFVKPLNFGGAAQYVGAFRIPNARGFHEYVGGRFFDRTFYAPADAPIYDEVRPLFGIDCEYAARVGGTELALSSSYVTSPAAMFHPDVLRSPNEGGFVDPDSFDDGYASPTVSQALYPDLKTRMIEHSWLYQPGAPCNPAFQEPPCTPYYFNHGWRSIPQTLFFDGGVHHLSVREAMANDDRHQFEMGYGLWSRDTPWGSSGYLIDFGYDFLANTSFHILTTDGIRGRDTLGF